MDTQLNEEQLGWLMFTANARQINGAPLNTTEEQRAEARVKFNAAPEELKKTVLTKHWALLQKLGNYNI